MFFSQDWTFEAKKEKDKIVIFLGYEDKLEKYAVFENGTLEINLLKPKPKKVDDDSCNFLYHDIYIANMRTSCKSESWDNVGGASTIRQVNYLWENPYFNLGPMGKLCQDVCKIIFIVIFRL